MIFSWLLSFAFLNKIYSHKRTQRTHRQEFTLFLFLCSLCSFVAIRLLVAGSQHSARKNLLEGDTVVDFHKLPEMQPVTLKVLRWEERDKRLIIKEAQMVA
jgi:hypothetical protein